ncbi:alpha-glucosidase C-terminal domain-containing protein [Paracerasibacillus soli]|uniref:Alpha-glucosidase C-terminal domain-containing protein n=1 Tax=Paracerasibacillus soli TaxID=480284 RepID=A0ABU5CMQ0_9BACI|nr:alpha-glucosidase C-terminal domain-containing protein [Virgibacillus soli]MDY0407644.1 alpha-glucosidase C-terminal domain-containing protein [Virgibacillus soli]
MNDLNSIFYHYKQLIALRKKHDVITYGDYELLLADNPHIFAYRRQWNGETLLVISNFYEENVSTQFDLEKGKKANILLSNYPTPVTR